MWRVGQEGGVCVCQLHRGREDLTGSHPPSLPLPCRTMAATASYPYPHWLWIPPSLPFLPVWWDGGGQDLPPFSAKGNTEIMHVHKADSTDQHDPVRRDTYEHPLPPL